MRVRLPVVEEQALATLARLHRAVDSMAAPVAAANAERMRCARGCSGCCVDELTVFALEAAQIAARYPELLANEAPHAPGACAFLDAEGSCRIYAHRPYVCRTQGLPLRWLEPGDGDPVELRDICELNLGDAHATPLTDLPATHCFTLGPVEARLHQEAAHAHASERIPLRTLFTRTR